MEITIKENEFHPLLDREKAVVDSKRAFSVQLEMLRDAINYGTNLIPRCFGSSNKELKDIVVIAILLRQVVAMLDAMELLTSNGAVYAVGLQARAIFEASVYIDWILQSDAEKKATYYYVHNVRRQRRSAQRLQPGSPEATTFLASMPDLDFLRDPQVAEHANKALKEIERVLSQPEFAVVSKAFDQCTRKHPNWYEPLGMRSLNALVDAVAGRQSTPFFTPSGQEQRILPTILSISV